MENLNDILSSYISRFELTNGLNKTAIPYISILFCNQQNFLLPDMGNPYIFLVVNGNMRLYNENGFSDYSPGQYFISAINSPRTAETFSVLSENTFAALLIEFSLDDVISVMLDIDGDLPEKIFDENTSEPVLSCTDEKIINIVVRLFSMTSSELTFMGKHLKKELIFDLITGLHGKQFMQNIIKIQQAGDIYYINSWIKQNYKIDFSVEDLAKQGNMSLSSFHQKFKRAVGMGPLQCQKKLRLMEARRLMLDNSANVTDAAMEVGYESVSQFIRDYRRMFGRSPQKDVQEIKECIGAQAKKT